MNSKFYKSCVVPHCKNTTIRTPNKLFIHVPHNKEIRRKWLILARRTDVELLSSSSTMYFCEDHFDLPNDMENFMEYRLMGYVSKIRLKPGCFPKKFEYHNQPDKRKGICSSIEPPYIGKKSKMIGKESVESSTQNWTVLEDTLNASSDDALILKSPKVEIPDEQDKEEEILAALVKEEEMNIEQDLNAKPCLLTNSEASAVTLYGTQIKIETPEETSDLGKKASDNAVLLKSPKLEISDEQDDKVTLAIIKEENIKEHDLDIRSCSLIKSEPTADTQYSEIMVTVVKVEETSDLGKTASDDAVLLKSPKVEIPDEQDEEEEDSTMLEEDMIIEQDLNFKSCFLANNESKAGTLHSDNMVTKFEKLERIKSETSEENSDLGNKASGADTEEISTTTLSRGVSLEPDKTFICNDCGKQFDKKSQLIQHIESHNTALSAYFHCTECDYQTFARDTLERHLRLHDKTRPHQCVKCRYRYTTKTHLQRHMKNRHSENKNEKESTINKPFTCSLCQYQCCRQSILERHMRVHTGEKPFSCSICGHKFSEKTSIKMHMRIHTGEKPFSCSICAYTTSRKSNLNVHMSTHAGEKSFSCSICEYKCYRQVNLKKHMRKHTDGKPFSCSICAYICSEKSYLKKHMTTHTGEKPFSCSLCKYKCYRPFDLKRHIRKHTGEKPFSCSVCEHNFAQKIQLIRHNMRVHTGEKPFS